MNLLEEKERIKADKTLSPHDRKRALQRIRKLIKKNGIEVEGESLPTPKETSAHKAEVAAGITFDELTAAVASHYKEHYQELTGEQQKTLGYAFSLRQAANLKVTDPTAFSKKFTSRWGYEPKTFFTLKKGMDVLLFLGPVHTGN